MKYGMRERISGAVILLALAVIFVPMLFDEPAPREERPEPVLTIEQPVPVERHDVPDPQPPESLAAVESGSEIDETADDEPGSADERVAVGGAEAVSEESADDALDADASAIDDEASATQSVDAADDAAPQETPVDDPIAELTARLEESAATNDAAGGGAEEWAVQVGSFGEPANAERLENQLGEQGYSVYRRQRDNDLTTVYVGPFASSEEGERVMGELKQDANLQGLLVRVKE
ncbi:SPOR domain-containing protein [Halomonas faecis]|uniref:SPOR domain-containing protein n=1 Tax=Halomonas faecis TaxID=1562110 RepID=UPI0013D6E9AB|nr:SPOR domain-containing protein [Halomonas faecis]